MCDVTKTLMTPWFYWPNDSQHIEPIIVHLIYRVRSSMQRSIELSFTLLVFFSPFCASLLERNGIPVCEKGWGMVGKCMGSEDEIIVCRRRRKG